MSTKWVYSFGETLSGAAAADSKGLLGGKGLGLAQMTQLGLRVPPGFTITTEACREFWALGGHTWPAGLERQVDDALATLEQQTGKRLGDPGCPLLVSVRSGARISMPGCMDTCLNLGMDDAVVAGLLKLTNSPWFVYDTYRRCIQMYAEVVLAVPHEKFEDVLDEMKRNRGVRFDSELLAEDLQNVARRFLEIAGPAFPRSPRQQVRTAVDAVFNSWNNARAVAYRNIHGIPHDMGTAVNVQTMVFGNWSLDSSATGVGFSRNPSSGERQLMGEFLYGAAGEDVVAGIRTPMKLEEMKKMLPACHDELVQNFSRLEKFYREMQDVEFTIENGVLYMLQCRTGKRTARAAVRIAVDMATEGLITRSEAILRVDPRDIDQLLHKQLDRSKLTSQPIARGLAASPGAAVGRACFRAEDAVQCKERMQPCVLIRLETSAEDIVGMHAAEGVLTARGGMTSHAAVIARGMNKCCVAGCSGLEVSETQRTAVFTIAGNEAKKVLIHEGDVLSLDGSTGEVFLGTAPLMVPQLEHEFATLLSWADGVRRLQILANADTPENAKDARRFGAEGCGLTRTERMFFAPNRILHMRDMILATSRQGREEALAKLLPFQRQDFIELLKEFSGLPVIIRLLDPPLHEFLPKEMQAIEDCAREMRIPTETLRAKIAELSEFNPMLGFRGCRVGIVYPEIVEMQAAAIFEAAIYVKEQLGGNPRPHIEIPLAGHVNELRFLHGVVSKVAQRFDLPGKGIEWKFGAMLETPRACLTADQLAEVAEFFSFGTNDLTQTTLGFSRDDSAKFLKAYLELGIYPTDPFQTLDIAGVGQLIVMAVARAKSTRPNIDISLCGEVGGDPSSIQFLVGAGLNSVSVSAFRVPIARLAAAQAQLRNAK